MLKGNDMQQIRVSVKAIIMEKNRILVCRSRTRRAIGIFSRVEDRIRVRACLMLDDVN